MTRDSLAGFEAHERAIFEGKIGDVEISIDPLEVFLRIAEYADERAIAFWDDLDLGTQESPADDGPAANKFAIEKLQALSRCVRCIRFGFSLNDHHDIDRVELLGLWHQMMEFASQLKKKPECLATSSTNSDQSADRCPTPTSSASG